MSRVAEKITKMATELRKNNSSRYGTKGTRSGKLGYVEGGWRLAIQDATQQYYEDSGRMPSQATIKRKENHTLSHWLKIDPEQDALYRGYKMQLQALKTKYHQEGLKVVKPRNPKKPNPKAPTRRKRLPPYYFVIDIQDLVFYI